MDYITFEDYSNLGFSVITVEADFKRLLPKASDVLDHVTGHFYRKNSLEDDYEWRSIPFKKALCTQMDYFFELSATTTHGLNSTPQSIQIGRTSISSGARRGSGEASNNPLACEDIYIYLAGTGLLFRGVEVRR